MIHVRVEKNFSLITLNSLLMNKNFHISYNFYTEIVKLIFFFLIYAMQSNDRHQESRRVSKEEIQTEYKSR